MLSAGWHDRWDVTVGHAKGEAKESPLSPAFDRRIKFEFHGARITSDGGLLAYRELDDVLGLAEIAITKLLDGRRGKNTRHKLSGLFRQSVFGRLAGYEDVNDAERLARDPAMRAIVGRDRLDRAAASSSQMARFETEWLATDANMEALTDLSGVWIDRVHARKPPDGIILDMDSSESPTHGEQEGSAYNGHFGCTCYHPLFVFNQFGDLERCRLRPGNVHSAEDWRLVLEPVIARYRERGVALHFRADAAFAKPEVYELLEAEGIRYAIRLPANQVLQERIGYLLKRPVGRPPKKPIVSYASFHYQAKGWTRARRVIAKVEWHQGELYPRVGFIVTNLSRPNGRVVKFYNGRGTAEQWIKEGKNALRWTRLSCHAFRHNAVRLQLHALAYNLANFLRTLALPEEVEHWSLTTLREKLVKIGARIVRHGRYIVFQLAEVAVPRALFAEILRRIDLNRNAQLPSPPGVHGSTDCCCRRDAIIGRELVRRTNKKRLGSKRRGIARLLSGQVAQTAAPGCRRRPALGRRLSLSPHRTRGRRRCRRCRCRHRRRRRLELGDPAGDALKVAAAAAVLDVTCRMEPLAVPRAGRGIGKAAAIAFHVAGDVEDAPGALFATIERLDDVDGAAVEIATLQRDLIGDLNAVGGLGRGLLADAIVERDIGLERAGGNWRSRDHGRDGGSAKQHTSWLHGKRPFLPA